jgi:hypothetical protein
MIRILLRNEHTANRQPSRQREGPYANGTCELAIHAASCAILDVGPPRPTRRFSAGINEAGL